MSYPSKMKIILGFGLFLFTIAAQHWLFDQTDWNPILSFFCLHVILSPLYWALGFRPGNGD